jgi:serine/threonine protein kinase
VDSSLGFGETLNPDNASQAWDLLSQRVEAFIRAWETASEPPTVSDFLPPGPVALRRLALVELIKVDLEYRWRRRDRRLLETYIREFPELAADGEVPCDLIYEEYHVRRQSQDDVDVTEYFERFPGQAAELGRLLGLEAPHLTTTLVTGDRPVEIEAGDQVDDFDLLSRLGKGAFASVFLARQRSMQRLVALKISGNQGTEPQTMAQLDHPHIVRVYDQRILPERRTRLLYMQYIPGGTLQAVVDACRHLPPAARAGTMLLNTIDQALLSRGESPPTESATRRRLAAATWPVAVCWLGARLAGALDYAHRRNVLHRDVKPANVLLASDGNPKLADFNISFCGELEGVTAAAYFGGSLAYMSPEQLFACDPANATAAGELDGRSDVYSLSVMLWELLTGSRPFEDAMSDQGFLKTLEDMAARRRQGIPPAALARLPTDCPPGLLDVLKKGMAADRDKRYANAGQMAKALDLCLQPRAQRLFQPAPGGLRHWARKWPITALVLAGTLPHALMSPLNILYNFGAIVKLLPKGDQAYFQNVQLTVVNGIAFPLGIAVLLAIAWPLMSAVRRVQRGSAPAAADVPALVRRCLTYGDVVAIFSLVEWLAAGIAFPVWIHLRTPNVRGLGDVYLHFFTSQMLCGLIAATVCFFLVTIFMVRVVYPMLSSPETIEMTDPMGLLRLARRAGSYWFVSMSVPFLAMIVLALVERDDLRWVFIVLALIGGFCVGVTYVLRQELQKDLDTLALAASPQAEGFGSASDTVESFWTGSSRRT